MLDNGGNARTVTKPIQVDWTTKPARHVVCPICSDRNAKPFVLNTELSWSESVGNLDLHACPSCECMFFPDLESSAYEGEANIESAVKFYVEVGAGLELLTSPGYIAPLPAGSRYLEIGCGFGFGLDYARSQHDHAITGLDPSKIAQFGKRMLDLPTVAGYLTRQTDLGDRRFDLVVASEVIEHVFDPREFVDILAARLDAQGVLLINTPFAGSVKQTTSLGALLPLLSPGWHYILFSAKALESLLRAAGFKTVGTLVREHTLLAYATNGERPVDLGATVDPIDYRAYLEKRGSGSAHPWVRHGLQYRLLKLQANAGQYAEALATYAHLRREIQSSYGFDIEAPLKAWFAPGRYRKFHDFALAYPMCLCGIGYARGIIALNHERDYRRAEAGFAMAVAYGSELRARLQAIGADDGETETIVDRSRSLMRRALAYVAPAEVVQRVLAENGHAEDDLALFTHLVNLGFLAEAASLAPYCERLLRGGSGMHTRGTPSIAAARRALGIVALNHEKSPRRAASQFAAAVRAAGRGGSDDSYWPARVERLLAWMVAGNAACAEAALAPLKAAIDAGLLREDLSARVVELGNQLAQSRAVAVNPGPSAAGESA